MKSGLLAFIVVLMSVWAGFLWSMIGRELIPMPIAQNKEEVKNTETNVVQANIADLENEIIKVWNSVSESVVSIIVKKDLQLFRQSPFWAFGPSLWTVSQEVSGWTWFFIDEKWTILTNKHVINNNWDDYLVVTKSGEEFDAEIIWIDQLTDLAVIKINPEKPTPKVEFIASEENVKLGQFWIAIWNALSKFQNSVTLGIISWKNRSIEVENKERLNWLIQTDAAINPWNSGWPLVNIEGKVMWINTAISGNAMWIWFAIPLSTKRVEYITSSLEKYGKIKRPFVWVYIKEINSSTKNEFETSVDYWNYIQKVTEGSNAEKAGLKSSDIILEADGQKLLNRNLTDIIQNKIPWDLIKMKVYRDAEILDIEVLVWEI